MSKPFFSIIIPTYNREKFLKIAIRSVLEQSSDDYELIVVDDGSKDNTKKLFDDLGDKKAKYLYQRHQGVSSARNKGIAKAKGEFICFLDSDDRFRHNKLEITYQYIKKYPEYKIFHTEEIWYRRGQLLPQKIYHKKPTGFVFESAAKLCSISISTAAIKRDIFNEIGLFDETMPACEDYDFWLRLTHRQPVFLIPQYLTIKEGGHPDQQSIKFPAMDTLRIYALQKILESGELNKKNHKIALNELKIKCEIFIKGALKRGKVKEIQHYQKLMVKFNKSR
ncbi:MAG: glycosyltransferase [Candidatus Omnitrophota bacterium]|nr:glycosyltransferase [Candidatus Omnitrophota bacterium]